ncbi:DNA-processing protein DprA [Candidatus Parcubacteria bacterium]|nr:DNA-processing protein DprA [Candidatus Parcubacteria bacterium]
MAYPIIEIDQQSSQYPEILKHIAQPPAKLYCRGNVDLLNTTCFAVVGTRRATPYGHEAVISIIPSLSRHFTIVSGLALGIDAAAHQATLNAHGNAIIVLGSSVEDVMIGPRTNFPLAQNILNQNGLIISEYPPKSSAHKGTFPARNRIISGLSKGVLIIEADERSGSLITARQAIDQNRDVFAVPGSIFSSKSSGPNTLLKKGAKLVTSANDILEEYDHLQLTGTANLSTQHPVENKILAILQERGPSDTELIIRETGLNASEIMAALSMMEISGLIRQNNSGQFIKN